MDRLTRRSYGYTGTSPAVSLETTRVDYAYDSCGSYTRGRLCSVTAKKGATEVSRTAYNRYDALGRVLESTQTTGGQPYTMAYAYDRAGNLIRQRYPSERVVDYVYDGAGRIAGAKTGIDDWYAGGTGDNAVGYEPHGGVKQLLLGNGLWEQRRYNARLQPTQIGLGTTTATGGTLVATGTTPSAGLLLLDYSYGTISNNGNVLSQQIRVGDSLDLMQAYTYDELNRLKTSRETGNGTTWSQTYTYDLYGNRAVTAGRNYGSHEALTAFNASNNRLLGGAAYDGAGNLTLDWGGRRVKYDGDNRMVNFRVTAGGMLTNVKYRYDGEGRRVQKEVVGGKTTTYVYNAAGQLVAEYAGTVPGALRYLTPDHLGSTRVVTGAVVSGSDGGVVSRHDYLPFGEEIGSLGGRTAALKYSASGPAQKFTGKERDTESGLDYFNARYFSGAGGRFTSVDPENAGADPADPQSWNGYAYARNNPLLYTDPDGRDFEVCRGDGDDRVCTTYTNKEFYKFLAEEKLDYRPQYDEGGVLLPSNIYSVDEGGDGTLYGTATYFNTEPGIILGELGPFDFVFGGIAKTFFGKLGGRLLSQSGSGIITTSLSRKAVKILGALYTLKNRTVREVILERGGNASNVRKAGHYADETLGELAEAYAQKKPGAKAAMKIVRQAKKKAQKSYGQ